MTDSLQQKLNSLPNRPGVYFHKSESGEIIYVGKAAVLRNRVRQYFQSSRGLDAKTMALVAEIVDVDWIETDSEIDALFLESEMVKRYMPRYNVLLRDDKSQSFVRVDMNSEWPTVTLTRGPLDDGAEYYGPFYNSYALRKALRYLRRVFPYFVRPPKETDSKLEMQIGLNPDMRQGSEAYKQNLRKLISYIKGRRKQLANEIESDMKRAAREQRFEDAARLRNRLNYMQELQRRIMFGDREYLDISKDRALSDLAELMGLANLPQRIEGYDISHMGGTNVVASMVVFTNGVSDRSQYRKFKTKLEHNNDFYNMNETILRRFGQRNMISWGQPDLVLIDGGKGQLEAAIKARQQKLVDIPFVGIAKKQEQIVISRQSSLVELNMTKLAELDGYLTESEGFLIVNLPHSSHIVKLLQRVRDESHRFAVSYHTVLKRKQATSSILDGIPSIGPATKKKLLKHFGSVRGIGQASLEELTAVVGGNKASKLKQYLPSQTSK